MRLPLQASVCDLRTSKASVGPRAAVRQSAGVETVGTQIHSETGLHPTTDNSRLESEDEMSDEPKCICGHPRKEHLACVSTQAGEVVQYYGECLNETCDCEYGRPSLPWPDSEGAWWCDKFDIPLKVSRDVHGFIVGEQSTWFRRKEFERLLCGPARFTKLLERNPCESTPG